MDSLLKIVSKQLEEVVAKEMEGDDFGSSHLPEDDDTMSEEEKSEQDDSGDHSLDLEEKPERLPELKLTRSCNRLVQAFLTGEDDADDSDLPENPPDLKLTRSCKGLVREFLGR